MRQLKEEIVVFPIKIKQILTIAAVVGLGSLAQADIGSLAVPCPQSPTGFATRSQVESGNRAFAGCRHIFEAASPTCNADQNPLCMPQRGDGDGVHRLLLAPRHGVRIPAGLRLVAERQG
jgi:hypothetical protein